MEGVVERAATTLPIAPKAPGGTPTSSLTSHRPIIATHLGTLACQTLGTLAGHVCCLLLERGERGLIRVVADRLLD